MVADVYKQIDILSAHRLVENPLRLAGAETRAHGVDNIGVFFVVVEMDGGVGRRFISPGDDILVYLLTDFSAALKGNDSEIPIWNCLCQVFLAHCLSSVLYLL